MLSNTENTKDFVINTLLLSDTALLDQESREYHSLLKRERTNKPLIYVGTGTCGNIAGAPKTIKAIKEYLAFNEIEADIIESGCIGLCSSEPIVDVQLPGMSRISFEKITEDKVNFLLDGVFNNVIPKEHVLGQHLNEYNQPWEKVPDIFSLKYFNKQKRLILQNCGITDPLNINDYIAYGGYKALVKTLRRYTANEVCDLVEKSHLRGRGGGGFRTGIKWKTAANNPVSPKYLICNADESDPGAFMDRSIIEGDPHKLIEGIAIATYAINAKKAIIYIRGEYKQANIRLKRALEQAYDYGFLGNNVMDSGNDIQIEIRMAAGAFVCGEETALINSLEGNRGTARIKPPFPTAKGLFQKPTVVNNVETLANIPLIIDKGLEWFTAIGTKESTGTKVFSLTGKTIRSGLIEVPMGTTIKSIINDIGGGIKKGKGFKAVLIGGPSGGIITKENLDIPIDFDSLVEVNAMMGSGGMVVMDENTCIVDIAKFLIQYLQKESCGKCIPCRQGTQRILEILENITRKPDSKASHHTLERFKGIVELESLAEVIKTTSLCGLGKSAANPIITTLKYFRNEYEEHIFDRKCRTGVCTEMRSFYIDVDKCTGCTLCSRKCPANAIIGSPKNPHFIIEDKCIGCGLCYESCKFRAINIK